MTKPQSLPVEEARKKFADLLDDSQFRSAHTAITRRGKTAGIVVPPEWYARAVEALAQNQGVPHTAKREPKNTTAPTEKSTPAAAPNTPTASQPAPQEAESSDPFSISPEVAALSYEQARDLFKDAEVRNIQWAFRMRRTLSTLPAGQRFYAGVQAGVDEGIIDLPGERPAGSEETST